jgi:hypothetical protein
VKRIIALAAIIVALLVGWLIYYANIDIAVPFGSHVVKAANVFAKHAIEHFRIILV